ncbi:MAG: prepilin-type N-terminal cleavage/methylation domain-containing protein [Candidatus Marinimicrobia bacterium]|jgi:prepilin-type N-terminal cleavage/methylation domain-containing protein|nr:prepilin-type N-terminal cleavage/methylation domain-containing protein [Candidatus Neomarinimicrobiota bacterium]MBT3937676.1 prepilin-type N-terminal cleavage/methylation domain-containing protein [Candidatus Neomarinimicrobiota bacterium]
MNKNSNFNNQRGFTLIEMILVVLAIGIIGTMAASMLSQGSDIYKETVYRQSFLGQARSVFWRMMRESNLQRNAENFTLSGSTQFYSTNAKNETVQFAILGSDAVNYTASSGSTYPLSNQVKTNASIFRYYKNATEELTLTSGQTLTQSEAGLVQLLYLDMYFKRDNDSIRLSSYIYPQNFRYGKKMSYHD